MSFWNTFVGKAIHNLSFGLIGPDSGNGAPSAPLTKNVDMKCYTDPDYAIKNFDACNPSAGKPNTGPVLPPPPIQTCTVNCGTGGISTPTPAVPEPEVFGMAVVGVLVVGAVLLRKKFSRK